MSWRIASGAGIGGRVRRLPRCLTRSDKIRFAAPAMPPFAPSGIAGSGSKERMAGYFFAACQAAGKESREGRKLFLCCYWCFFAGG